MGAVICKPSRNKIKRLTMDEGYVSSRLPVFGSNTPLLINISFWSSLFILKYLFVAYIVSIFNYPEELYVMSAQTMTIAGYLISTYTFVYNRQSIREILRDGLSRLSNVSPQGVSRINQIVKWYVIVAVVYNVVVFALLMVFEPAIKSGHDPHFSFVSFQSLGLNKNVSPVTESICAVTSIVSQLLSFLTLRLFLVITLCLIFLHAARLSRHLNDILEDTANPKQMDLFNEHFIFVINLIRRQNNQVKGFLAFWFFGVLYSTINSLIALILTSSNEGNVAWIPNMSQDLLIICSVTIFAAKIPEAINEVSEKLLTLSRDFFEKGRMQDYVFIKLQLQGEGFGVKIAGLFLITRSMFLSFVGMGVTYTIVYIQFNPKVLRKLQGEVAGNCSLNS